MNRKSDIHSTDYKNGYSAGYAAGKKADPKVRTTTVIKVDRTEVYKTLLAGLIRTYSDGGWGSMVEGKHEKYAPGEIARHAITEANRLIKEVRV